MISPLSLRVMLLVFILQSNISFLSFNETAGRLFYVYVGITLLSETY